MAYSHFCEIKFASKLVRKRLFYLFFHYLFIWLQHFIHLFHPKTRFIILFYIIFSKVSLLVPSSEKIKEGDEMLHKIYQVPLKPHYIDDYIRLVFEGFWKQGMARLMDFQKVLCEGALNSTEFLKKERGYDLLVYDSPTAMCGVLVSRLLSIPRVQILIGTSMQTLCLVLTTRFPCLSRTFSVTIWDLLIKWHLFSDLSIWLPILVKS